jgi:phage shock protein E
MTRNVQSRRYRRTDDGAAGRAISYQRCPAAHRVAESRRALAALLIVGALSVACLSIATAGEPVATAPASAPAHAAAAVVPMSQEALLEHQSGHPDHLFVLDVRTPQEYAEGHVPGAVNVPQDQLASRLAEVPKDKDVVLYCKSGRRAAIAADVLAANGYTRLSHLEGDMNAWLAKGRPVAKP